MRVAPKKTSKITNLVIKHLQENIRAYVLVCIILLIGIVLGVFFVNNMQESQKQEVQEYLVDFTQAIKDGSKIDNGMLLRKTIGNNLTFTIFMWFVGSTVIGIPIMLGMVAFRGFCLGYTVSSSIAIWGVGKGVLFFVSSMLLQNLIFIPCMLALAVSGIKLYKSIMKDKRKENIKFEIFRHTIFSLIILAVLIAAAFVETYISTTLLTYCVSYL